MLWPDHRVSSISFIFIPSSYPMLSVLNLFLYFVFCILLHTMFVRQLWMIFPSAYDSWAVITSKRPQWSYTSPAIVWNICHVSHPVLAVLFEHVAHDTYTFTSKHQFNWFPTSFFMSEYWKCPHRSQHQFWTPPCRTVGHADDDLLSKSTKKLQTMRIKPRLTKRSSLFWD